MTRARPRLALGDRLRTVAITAIFTSAAWILFGGALMDSVGKVAVLRKVKPAAGLAAAPPASAAGAAARSAARAPGTYVIPVAGVRPDQLTDTFAAARAGGARLHDAIDIIAPRGTPVVAAVEGRVEKLFTSRPGGLTIYVRSPDRRTITYYAHLDAYAPGLAEGQQLHAGDVIGAVGSTGNASGGKPHLHFAIMETTPQARWWDPARDINPYPILTQR